MDLDTPGINSKQIILMIRGYSFGASIRYISPVFERISGERDAVPSMISDKTIHNCYKLINVDI